ncbi:MAG: SWIM zinc finger family protein [Candidatus Aenigmarchaeota archaeon]|nr:SWIM zinc finger family protein [Candidatus Aenigmarchaeota archaeon]
MPDARQARGQVLAEMQGRRIKQVEGSLWFSPSAKSGGYLINVESGQCGCPDGQNGTKCKHVWAVEIVRSAADSASVASSPPKALPRGDLTTDEQDRVRVALRSLRTRYRGQDNLEKALRIGSGSLHKPLSGHTVSASIAVRVARLAGTSVDSILAGEWPPPGMCHHCGRGPG